MASIKQGTNFPTHLVKEMFSTVKGKSSIARMAGADPIAFNGNTEFTFSLNHELEIVGEGENKSAGDGTITPVTIRPVKVVCQARVSNEFMYASEEEQLEMLETVVDGYSKTIAKGVDKMIMHGVNPYTGNASSVIGTNHLDAKVTQKIEYTHGTDDADVAIDDAIALVEEPTGVILNKTMRGDIAAMRNDNGGRVYPEFAWGATPSELGGMALDTNATAGNTYAYVGDWNALKWGYAKEMPIEIIEYGDPDGQGDLKRKNEVVIRIEAFIGWGILNAADFAKVVAPSS